MLSFTGTALSTVSFMILRGHKEIRKQNAASKITAFMAVLL